MHIVINFNNIGIPTKLVSKVSFFPFFSLFQRVVNPVSGENFSLWFCCLGTH